MSFLGMLFEENDGFTDSELVCTVQEIEGENFVSSDTDSQLLQDVEEVEQNELEWGSVSDSQLFRDVHDLEEKYEQQCWGPVTNSQLLQDVKLIESSLNELLDSSQPDLSSRSIASYQGPGLPMPTMNNTVVYMPKVKKTQCKVTFDLGYGCDFNKDDGNSPAATVTQKPASAGQCSKTVLQKSQVASSQRIYHKPHLESDMNKLGCKKFTPETDKKIHWVLNMFHQWREYRNKCPDLIHIWADLDHVSYLQKSTLSYGLCHFITEI